MSKRKNQPPIGMHGVSVDDAIRAAMKTPVEPKPKKGVKKKEKKK
jgi:hypothetical protein